MNKKAAALLCALIFSLTAVSCEGSSSSGAETSASSSASAQADSSGSSGNSKSDAPPADKPEAQPARYVSGAGEVTLGTQSGFYADAFDLTMSASDPDSYIFYTTDGSDPDMNSELYTGPVRIENCTGEPNTLASERDISPSNDHRVMPSQSYKMGTVIKAAAFKKDGSHGDVSFGTYFVGVDRGTAFSDVPVISIAINKDYLFDHDTGIYVMGAKHEEWLKEKPGNKNLDGWKHVGNYSQTGKEWERRASVQLIENDGTIGFSQDLGVRIKGGASRGDTQKSLKFIAREEYGKKSIKYPIMPDNMRSDGTGVVDKYKSFAIRNGGNDANYARLRDPFLQHLAADRDFETMGSRNCVAFINGEYWGMYTITDDYSDNYFENNYPVKDDNVIIVKRGELEEGEESDLKLFEDMVSFINTNDMSNEENYSKASDMLDMQSFADFCAFHIYINNEDCLFKNDNNWRLWRVRTPDDSCEQADGRWRMAVYDTDFSTGIYSGDSSFRQSLLGTAVKGTGFNDEMLAKAVSSLIKNDAFKKMFANALLDIRNYNFEPEHVKSELEACSEEYLRLMPDTYLRFGPDYLNARYNTADKINEFRSYLTKRYSFMPENIQKYMELGEIRSAVIKTGEGSITVNNTVLASGSEYTAAYLSECPVTLTAKAPDGKRFVRWEVKGVTLSDASSETVTLLPSEDCEIEAVFE
ncbi:MAG: CotH kinase family protein [Ruminococcus sp.]|nr:CotH kinase family protein [Ruminococcus sp.]